MTKVILIVVGLVALFGTSFYVSTEIGLRSEGWHEVTLEVPRNPGYAVVGQSFSTPDGSRLQITGVARGSRGTHQVRANVHGTHRQALTLFPPHWEHSFAMDRPSAEWTLRMATGQAPAPLEGAVGRQWHVLN